jgi:hypothetical protein
MVQSFLMLDPKVPHVSEKEKAPKPGRAMSPNATTIALSKAGREAISPWGQLTHAECAAAVMPLRQP